MIWIHEVIFAATDGVARPRIAMTLLAPERGLRPRNNKREQCLLQPALETFLERRAMSIRTLEVRSHAYHSQIATNIRSH